MVVIGDRTLGGSGQTYGVTRVRDARSALACAISPGLRIASTAVPAMTLATWTSPLVRRRALALGRQLPGVERRADGTGGATGLHRRHHPADIADIRAAVPAPVPGGQGHDEVAERQVHARRHAEALEAGGDVGRAERGADRIRERAVGVVEDRRPEALEIVVHQLLERIVPHQVAHGAHHLAGHRGLRHERRALGDRPDAPHQRGQVGQVGGADQVAHPGARLDHVRGDAPCIQVGGVHAGAAGHVFPHVVHADAHQLGGVQCAASQMRGSGGVAGASGEGEVDPRIGEADGLVHAGQARRMPRDRDVHVGEGAVAHHEALGGAALLCRAAVIAHPAGDAVGGQPLLHRRRREQGGRAEQVVAAAMAHAAIAIDQPGFGQAGLLAQSRERVVFTEDGDHRPPLAGFTHDGGRYAGHVTGDAETLAFQHREVFGNAAPLPVGQLRHVPDPIRQGDVAGALVIHDLPDLLAVLHAPASAAMAPG